LLPRRDGVVPVAVEGMALNVEGSQFGIADFDAFGIAALVDVASDGEAGFGGSGADQLDDDVVADERFGAPVLGDVGKEAVLDAVPFAGAGWQMGDGYNQAGLVGKALQFTFPEADAGTVAAAAIGRDGQGWSLGIAFAAQPLPPAADALDRKFGGIGIDPDIDPSLVRGNVIDAVRRHLTQAFDLEVMDAHRLGISPRLRGGRLLRRSSRPPFLKSPTNSIFLVSTEIAG
jgi:hypothetical protein